MTTTGARRNTRPHSLRASRRVEPGGSIDMFSPKADSHVRFGRHDDRSPDRRDRGVNPEPPEFETENRLAVQDSLRTLRCRAGAITGHTIKGHTALLRPKFVGIGRAT